VAMHALDKAGFRAPTVPTSDVGASLSASRKKYFLSWGIPLYFNSNIMK
jgi:hypothetical protein